MIQRFRKKPVVIEAVKLTAENIHDVAEWCGGGFHLTMYDTAYLTVSTLEGIMRADMGAWIIRGVNGEFYRCAADIFAKTYEAA